jgi:hypothetical protein
MIKVFRIPNSPQNSPPTASKSCSLQTKTVACILCGATERPLSLFGKPRQARFCGNYSLSVEISGFTFDGNLTTSSFKIRAAYEGLLTIALWHETGLRSL